MYAHIRGDGITQSIKEHLEDTADYAKNAGSKVGLANLMYVTGMLHDGGKLSSQFQEYIEKAHQDPTAVKRGSVNHSSFGAKLIFEAFYKDSSCQRVTAQLISIAIASHHGLIDSLDTDGVNVFNKRVNPSKEIEYEKVLTSYKDQILSKAKLQSLFEKASGEVAEMIRVFQDIKIRMISPEKESLQPSVLFYLIGCLERLILSMLIDADYSDTADFMNRGLNFKSSLIYSHHLWEVFQQKLDLKLAAFIKTDKISLLRKRVSDECFSFAENPAGIYCLPVPTGGGKTLSAWRYSLEHCRRYQKERIIYVAPYLSILEQTANEIRGILDADHYILEHHSNIIMESENDIEQHHKMAETWEAPIILTTMVRLLNVLYSKSQQDIRRMHRLSNAIIIVDEVQNIPLRLIHGFNTMANFLKEVCNTTIVLCSATQPLLGDVDKPVLYSEPKNMIQGIDQLYLNFKRTEVKDKTILGGYTTEHLAGFVEDKMNQVENILIILNTKSAVKKLYRQLKVIFPNNEETEVLQLTTLMCAEHRSDVIAKLKKALNVKRIICVSTQLIEAGIDISFQCVIRSLAGLDGIIQAAGRNNRHGEVRMGYVYIINFNEENLASLPDMKKAQEATEIILREYKEKPENFDMDLLSPKAMKEFYKYYFFQRKNEMDYNRVKGTNKRVHSTLYDLLSIHQKGRTAYLEQNGKQFDLQLAQAFKTAGEDFEVIESNTIGLIVPYKASKNYIEQLKTNRDKAALKSILKKLQRYTVNLFQNSTEYKKLEARNAIDYSVLSGTVAILYSDDYYKEECGISDQFGALIF